MIGPSSAVYAAMDKAVMEKFAGVHCKTKYSAFTHRQETKWCNAADRSKLPPPMDLRIRDFVSGFKMAAKAFSA